MMARGTVPDQATKPMSSRAARALQTRARLVEAAKENFQTKGFLATTVADIVKTAGVAHGTFYTYFPSREDILREIAEEADAALNSPMQQLVLNPASELSPGERIRQAVAAFLEVYRRQAGIMAVVEEAAYYDEHIRAARAERLQKYGQELTRTIRSLQRRGLADRSLDPALTATLLGSITRTFPQTWLGDKAVVASTSKVAEHIATIWVRSLGIEPDSIWK